MPRLLRLAFAGIILGLIVGVPLAYATWHAHQFRNFHVVEEGVLYRSAQLPIEGLKRVIQDHGIKTVVTLRYAPSDDQLAPDLAEEVYCKQAGLHYFRLPFRAWEAKDEQAVPAEVNVEKFLEIMAEKNNYPVLVHCFAGIHRTGTFCAIYRMEFNGWTSEQAIREMREMGYTAYHRDVFGYLEGYRPRGNSINLGEQARRPPYTIAPLDVLVIDTASLTPRSECKIDSSVSETIRGQHLVRPDGTISLGPLGSAYVAGNTSSEVKCTLEKLLAQHFADPQLSVNVVENVAKTYVIVIDGFGQGQQVLRMPAKDNETVRDAIGHIQSMMKIKAEPRMWIRRPGPSCDEPGSVLPVDWKAIIENKPTETNYRLLPGDRLFVGPKLISCSMMVLPPGTPVFLGTTELRDGVFGKNGAVLVGR